MRNRSLLRAQLAFAAAWSAEWMFTVAIGVVAFRDHGAEAVGLVGFVRMVPAAIVSPLGAALGDRFPRDRVLAASSVVRAAASAGAALLLAGGGSDLAIYGLAVVATAAFTVFRPVHSALLPALCATPLELTSANVVRGLLDSVSTLVGPLIAALLLDFGSPETVFAATAALSAVAAALLGLLAYERPPRAAAQPLRRIVAETIEGFRALRRHPDAGRLIGLAQAASFTRGLLNVFVVVLALELLGMGAPGVGVLSAAVGAGAIVSSLGAALLVSGRHLAAIEGVGVALWGLPLSLCAAVPHRAAVIALICVIGVGNALADIGLYTLPARLVPDRLLARMFGAKESLTALTLGIGSLVAPLAIDVLGVRGALAALGLVAPACVLFSWPRLRAIDASIEHRDNEIDVLKRVSMFGPLPMPAIDELALHLDRVDYAVGEHVFHEGDPGDHVYVINTGEADVIGGGRVIATVRRGDAFGEIALLRNTARTTSIRARTALELYTLDRAHFLAAMAGYASGARAADELVAERLAELDTRR